MRYGLRTRLVALVLAIAVPLGAFVAYQIAHLYSHLHAETLEDTRRDARLVAVSLERFAHQMAEQGQAVGAAVTEGRLARDQADAYLRSLGRHVPVSNITVLAPDGRLLAAARPESRAERFVGLPAFGRVLDGAPYALSDVRVNATGRPGLVVFAPIGEPLKAVAAIALDGSDLASVVPVEAADATTVVADASGTVAYSDAPSVSGLAGRPGAFRSGIGEAEATAEDVRLPGDEAPHVGARSAIGSTGWDVLFYRPLDVAARHESRETATAVLAVVAVLLVAGLLARWAATGVLRPVEHLTDAVGRIAAGDLETPVSVRATGEIGSLAEGVGEMRASLARTFESVGILADAGRRLVGTMQPAETAAIGLGHLASILDAEAGVLTWHGAAGDRRLHTWGVGDAESLAREARRRIPDDVLATARRRVVLLHGPAAGTDGVRFLVSLPLLGKEGLLGRADLVAVPGHGMPEFERGDVELAAGLAQQVAAALQNAERFETERLIAETLQDSLLTEPFPVPGIALGVSYRPSTRGARVGGDFYDLVRVDDDRLAVVLGDISGKGLAAARHTVAAKGTIRAFILDDPSPASVLTRANVAIAEQLEVGTFVTAFYALLDTRSGSVRYAGSGHPAPHLVTPSGVASVLIGGGPPLGVAPGMRYEESSIALSDGDGLVLFSDGLTDARIPGGPLFGDEGIAEVLTSGERDPQRLADALAEAATRFAGGDLPDDLAVLVVSRSGARRG